MTLSQILRRLIIEDRCTPEEAADKVLAEADALAMVRSLVVWQGQAILRQRARKVERSVVAAGGLTTKKARRQLMAVGFALPSGECVTWGAATAAQHAARSGWMRHHATATLATARLHDLAASLIASAGVTCLNEVPDDLVRTLFEEAA